MTQYSERDETLSTPQGTLPVTTPANPTSPVQTTTTGSEPLNGRLIEIAAGAVTLPALLHLPANARGLAVLTHGIEGGVDGSHAVVLAIAHVLHRSSLATLVVDLFSDGERELDQGTDYFRLNTSIMEQRILGIADWAQDNAATHNLALGYFGAGAMGAAALVASAERPDAVVAVVSAGGRLELVQDTLGRVVTPALLIASQQDTNAIQLHQRVLANLTKEKRFEQLPGVLFATPQSVAQVAQLTNDWFTQYLEPIV
jgi:dienelactone hydrolase